MEGTQRHISPIPEHGHPPERNGPSQFSGKNPEVNHA